MLRNPVGVRKVRRSGSVEGHPRGVAADSAVGSELADHAVRRNFAELNESVPVDEDVVVGANSDECGLIESRSRGLTAVAAGAGGSAPGKRLDDSGRRDEADA